MIKRAQGVDVTECPPTKKSRTFCLAQIMAAEKCQKSRARNNEELQRLTATCRDEESAMVTKLQEQLVEDMKRLEAEKQMQIEFVKSQQERRLKSFKDINHAKLASFMRAKLKEVVHFSPVLKIKGAHRDFLNGCWRFMDGDGKRGDVLYKKVGMKMWMYLTQCGAWSCSNKEQTDARASRGHLVSKRGKLPVRPESVNDWMEHKDGLKQASAVRIEGCSDSTLEVTVTTAMSGEVLLKKLVPLESTLQSLVDEIQPRPSRGRQGQLRRTLTASESTGSGTPRTSIRFLFGTKELSLATQVGAIGFEDGACLQVVFESYQEKCKRCKRKLSERQPGSPGRHGHITTPHMCCTSRPPPPHSPKIVSTGDNWENML